MYDGLNILHESYIILHGSCMKCLEEGWKQRHSDSFSRLPKICPVVWALVAHRMFIGCPPRVHQLPTACSPLFQGQ